MIQNLKNNYRVLLLSIFGSLAFLFPLTASAQKAVDTCATIGSDPAWRSGIQEIVNAIQNDDLDNARAKSKELNKICENAPVLNYLQGKIAEAKSERKEALYYYQKASENTYRLAVEPDNAKKIWYARYEYEHPECTASALADNSAKLSSLRSRISSLEADNARLNEIASQHDLLSTDLHDTYANLLWTGVGIGAGGLAFAATGVALVAVSHSSKIERDNEKGYRASDDPLHATGWVLTGVGAGLLVTGAVLAGFYGYKYKNFNNNENDNNSNDMTLYVSPNSFLLNITF